MKAGEVHTLRFTTEQLGYLDMCARQILKKDRKGAIKFGVVEPESSLAHRLRVGGDVEEIISDARVIANASS